MLLLLPCLVMCGELEGLDGVVGREGMSGLLILKLRRAGDEVLLLPLLLLLLRLMRMVGW